MSERIAKKIASRLKNEGFQALFAGGWVRDRLLGIDSNDIDIATDATPSQVAKLFPKSILVGAQFGVVRVIEEGHEFEVATFRTDGGYQDGRKPESVHLVHSSREDALRRDFTINGMFFDPETNEVIDYVNGQSDLQKKIIRTIGNPHDRFKEDRLRMIRAIRFATTFDYSIDPKTWDAIIEFAPTLRPAVSPERIWQELNKIYASEKPKQLAQALRLFYASGLLQAMFLEPVIFDFEQIKAVPQGTKLPLIIGLLVPNNREEALKSFHTSNEEIQMVLFEDLLEQSLKETHDDAFWCHLYANSLFDQTLQILTKDTKHQQKKEELHWWIERIQKKEPLVTASDLLALRVKPGKELGILLKKAEQIAITERLKDKEQVLKKLL